jgi:tetratricopeptide (TPR) repeat protein
MDYATNVIELVTRLSKLAQFGDALKIVDHAVGFLSSCTDVKEQKTTLKDIKNELSEKMERLKRIDTEITPQIEDARRSHIFRKLYLCLGDRGKERLNLGLGTAAVEDFEEQRKIGENELKCMPEQLSKVYANLGKSYKLENRWVEAEQYLRKSLKPFNGSNEDKCEILKAIFEVIKCQNYGNHFRRVYTILDDINNLAAEMEDLDLQEEALENMQVICKHFGKRDELRIVDVRLKRVRLAKNANQDSIPDSDDDGYVQPTAISPAKDHKRSSAVLAESEKAKVDPKRRKATFTSLNGSQISEAKSPIAKKKNPVIVDSSQDSDSFLEDFRATTTKKTKREYNVLIRNLISSSLPEEIPSDHGVVPPRTTFDLDLNEYDREFVNPDEIDDPAAMVDSIIEVSDQTNGQDVAIEETIPATPSFGTDPGGNDLNNENQYHSSPKDDVIVDVVSSDTQPTQKSSSQFKSHERIPLSESFLANGTPPIPYGIGV